MVYIELQVTSNFSFLRGASHPEELVEQAAALGYPAIAIADHNTLAGIVRAHAAAKKLGIRLIIGCHLELLDGPALLAYPTDKAAYSRLSSLLTVGNLRAPKGKCHLYKKDVYQYKEGIQFISIPPPRLNQQFEIDPAYQQALHEYRIQLSTNLYLAAFRRYTGDDQKQLHRLAELAKQYDIPLVATNDVHYHTVTRRPLQDILTCIREKCTIHTAGFKLHSNAERHLKPIAEMQRLFRQYPDALDRTREIANACTFSLDELQYEYPRELVPDGRTAHEHLTMLTWKGAEWRYGKNIPEKITANILHELAFMKEMDMAKYFLTVEDIIQEANRRGILCQGRGSAANSTVCYCLGITNVDPMKHHLLFERFISSARNEPPDIDVDFEHDRREEIMQYVYQKYGRNRAGIIATVTQVHYKTAIRDVGKAMGLSLDMVGHLAATSGWHDEGINEPRITEAGFDLSDATLRTVLELTGQYINFPRQLGQHTGGFVITNTNLADLCPVMNAAMKDRTNVEWNKDDVDALGFLKIDLLALGMLSCLRRAFDLAKEHYHLDLTLANIPHDDAATFDMICQADTIGVFQIESRAQMSMLPRLRPRGFYDLVIQVAIVRPGPIVGNMVHPYLRRRNGQESVEYPSKELEEILGRTLGVPLFQEQAMKIAIVAAGFTPAEADELRRSMATFKAKGLVSKFEEKLIKGMTARGYSADYAAQVFRQLEGFGSYGFPESHAASFAHLAYASSWLKCHYPDVFCTALLNSQPMGFYQPAQIISDAKKHGVVVRPVDINYSTWDNRLEEKTGRYRAVRLGFRQVKGLRQDDMEQLIQHRTPSYRSIHQLRQTGVSQTALEKLADADAFRSLGLDRREALWELSPKDLPVALFVNDQVSEAPVDLPVLTTAQHVVQDYATTSLSLKAHPVSFLRHQLQQLHILSLDQLACGNNGDPVKVAGLVLVRQRPGTASGICFMTIEDETTTANVVIFENLFEKFRKEIMQSKLIMIEGTLQIEGGVIHVIAQRCYNFSKLLRKLSTTPSEQLPLFRSSGNGEQPVHVAQAINGADEQDPVFPNARNFK